MQRFDDMSTENTPVREPIRRTWSWKFGSLAGIPIRIHVTWFLLVAWIAISFWATGIGPRGTGLGVLLFVCVFASIVAHELAHALVAHRYGVKTRDILLLPIGGIASLEHIPDRPAQELAIAVVGPVLNLVIAGTIWIALAIGGPAPFFEQLAWINIALAAFNLIPALPLDGGRALRALLSMRLSRERATAIAATAGKVLASALAIIGFAFNPWFILLAVVVWLGASGEREIVRVRSALTGVPAREVMSRHIAVVDANDPVARAANMMVATGTSTIAVTEEGHIAGALTRGDVSEALRVRGPDTPVWSAPQHRVVRVPPDEPLDRLLDELEAEPTSIAVVVVGETPVGIVTPEQLGMYVQMHPSSERVTTT